MHAMVGGQGRRLLAAPPRCGFGRSYGRVDAACLARQPGQQESKCLTGTRLTGWAHGSPFITTKVPSRTLWSLSSSSPSSASSNFLLSISHPKFRRLVDLRAQMKTHVQTAFLVLLSTMHSAASAMVTKPLDSREAGVLGAPRDPNTLSNYNAFVNKHTDVDFLIDFDKKRLSGGVKLTLESLTDCAVDSVVLDTSFLDISDVKVDGETAKWEVGERVAPYGSPLTITLAAGVAKAKTIEVEIALATTANSTALQWMDPAQTSNKKHPYMFSQCQAIHARSVFPCQDTPDVKSTVNFKLRSPLPVVASGLPQGTEDGGNGTTIYNFKQEIPIPSYLFALASGDLASAAIGPRSEVWTGPNELNASHAELDKEIEPFMSAIESIVKLPYQWGVYNVLVLPPSFPYGGMENPVWTYATPTIISGDKQNVDVIAHELSHSWSGNLVSTASWEHFWLNEGWTTYLERRIAAIVHGEQNRQFSAIIGMNTLDDAIETLGVDNPYTKLVVDLKGGDPDDSFSTVPYEKGFLALYGFELLLGKETWDTFIPHYFETWKFKSLDSFEFKDTLINFFKDNAEASQKLADFDWDKLFFSTGHPEKPEFDDTLARTCYELADKWKARVSGNGTFDPKPEDIADWVANQAVVFLETVQAFATSFKAEDYHLMGETYGFLESQNVEVLSRFLGIGLAAKIEESYQPTADLLGRVGRMKFARPLYRALAAADRELAVATFEKNKDFYHPIARQLIEKDLFGDGTSTE